MIHLVWINKGSQGMTPKLQVFNLKPNYKMLLVPPHSAGRNALTLLKLTWIMMRPSNKSHYINLILILHKSFYTNIDSRKPRMPTGLQLHLLQMYTN